MKERNINGKMNFFQGIALLFFVGIFLGGFTYLIFKNSFAGLFDPFFNRIQNGISEDYSIGYKMVQALWRHGRFFLLFWLLSATGIGDAYRCLFLIVTGFSNGFFLFFLLAGKGGLGILLYFASLFPHGLFLVPLYIFSFFRAKEKSHSRRHKKMICILIGMAFLSACYLEAAYNISVVNMVIEKIA